MASVRDMAARYYARGLWGVAQIEALVEKGKLTEAEAAEILGTDEAEGEGDDDD